MKFDFIPVDYISFDFQGKNYINIIGRDNSGKKLCVIDSCDIYFWAILKDNLKEIKVKKLITKTKKIQLNLKGRQTKVEKVE